MSNYRTRAVRSPSPAWNFSFGLDLGPAPSRIYCRPCLDWSERRLHIGGTLGARLAGRCFALNWIRRDRESRAVAVTPAGERGFRETFGM